MSIKTTFCFDKTICVTVYDHVLGNKRIQNYVFLFISRLVLYGVINAKAHSLTFSTFNINHIYNTILLHHSFPRSMDDQRGATHEQYKNI